MHVCKAEMEKEIHLLGQGTLLRDHHSLLPFLLPRGESLPLVRGNDVHTYGIETTGVRPGRRLEGETYGVKEREGGEAGREGKEDRRELKV